MSLDSIKINNLKIPARHGVFEFEKLIVFNELFLFIVLSYGRVLFQKRKQDKLA